MSGKFFKKSTKLVTQKEHQMKSGVVLPIIVLIAIIISGCGGSNPSPPPTAKFSVSIKQSSRNDPFPPVSSITSITIVVTGETVPFELEKKNDVWSGTMTVHVGNNKVFTATAKNGVGKVIYKGETKQNIVNGVNSVAIDLYFADSLAQVVNKVSWPGDINVAKVTIKVEQDADVILEQFTVAAGETSWNQTIHIVIGTARKVTVTGYDGAGSTVCSALPVTFDLTKDEVKTINFTLVPVQTDLGVGLGINTGMPKVVIKTVAPLGETGRATGVVSGGIDPKQLAIVMYFYANGFWSRSGDLRPLTGSNFDISLDVDAKNAQKIEIALLPKGFTGNLLTGFDTLIVPDGTYSVSVYDRVLAQFRANSGVNLPWYNYGWDIGRHPWGGYHAGYSVNTNYAPDLAYLKSVGVNLVRIFVWCDLRSGILFGTGDTMTFDSYAVTDYDTMIKTAEAKDMKLMLTLFDWSIANGVSNEPGGAVGEHPELITDTAKTQALINLIKPLITKYKDNKAIFAYDIFNEPELATAVTQAQMKVFIQSWVSAIHEADPDALVTVGSHMRTDVANWTGLGLNFSQFHYYENGGFPVFDYPVSSIAGLENMAIVGEVRPEDIKAKLDTAYKNGCSGVLFWSLNANYQFRSYDSVYKKWMADHPVVQ